MEYDKTMNVNEIGIERRVNPRRINPVTQEG
jgi:hypothetical protein